MKIKNLIAGMLTVVMLAGPGTMTCYAAGSSEADAVSVNAASTEETADSAAAKEAPAVSQKGEESKAAETTGNHAADGAAENNEKAQNEEKPYTVTVDENGNTVYSIGDWKWSCEQSDESASSGIVNDKVSSYLHLRSGSGMEYDIIGHLLPGEEVQVVGEDGEWYQVVVPEKTGYVSKDYLKVLEKEKNDGNIDQEFMETMLGLMMESMEDEKSSAPLTPDGNMTLVDDIGSGYVTVSEHLFSDNFVTTMLPFDAKIASTNYLQAAVNCISSTSKNPERAMMALEIINTDPYFATTIRFGTEGKYWNATDEENVISFEGTLNEDPAARSNYYWYGAQFGSLVFSKVPSGYPNNFTELIQEANESAISDTNLGFIFDPTPVTNEIAACNAVIDEYETNLIFGFIPESEVDANIDEFLQKLNDSGAEKIVAEAQSQLDAWRAENK